MESGKPLGGKNYGSIPHLPGSRMGVGDHACHEGQKIICTEKARDRHDRIIVQEKLDGSNVGVAKIGGKIVALSRAGYLAETSPFVQHHIFSRWVDENKKRFNDILDDGERVVGEWLAQAHGTRYNLVHEPFVAFDIMTGRKRIVTTEFKSRVWGVFVVPKEIHSGGPISISDVMGRLGEFGFHGAIDPIEGAVWRVERNMQKDKNTADREWAVDFLAKYVRPDKVDGCYLSGVSGQPEVWNKCV